MTDTAKYLLIVNMDITPEKEDLFNEVYDTEHIPGILKVPGVLNVKRFKLAPLKINMAGTVQDVDCSKEATYTAIYEIEGPEVLESNEWGEAVEMGRWPGEVRPHTSNRQFSLRKVLA